MVKICKDLLGYRVVQVLQDQEYGDLLGHVIDLSKSADDQIAIYQTSARQNFHCEYSIVGLLCIQVMSGGASSILGSVTI